LTFNCNFISFLRDIPSIRRALIEAALSSASVFRMHRVGRRDFSGIALAPPRSCS